MHTWLSLSLNDVRNVVRDRLLLVIFFIPAILLLFTRSIMPIALVQFPDLANYQHIITMLASAQIPTCFGLIASFVMLDEKDERVFEALRSLPISANRFIAFRLGWVFGLSTLGSAMFMAFSGLGYLHPLGLILAAILYGMLSILITLLIVTYTQNKVEGLAVFKGLNIALYLPVLPWIWSQPWIKAFGILPSYWPFAAVSHAYAGQLNLSTFLIGFSILGIIVMILLSQFKRRVFR